jgi:glycosyltransferase involved in cell wall biosynthesis
MKPKLLIVFPDVHLAYSPTTLNLYDALEPHFEITILSFYSPHHSKFPLGERRVEYAAPLFYWTNAIICSLRYRLKLYFNLKASLERWLVQLERWLTAMALWRATRRRSCAVAIGVDFMGMWVVQRVFGRGHMLSLEILENDLFRQRVDLRSIDSLIIQTQERYDYLFKGSEVKYFLVQNAPPLPLRGSAPPAGAPRDDLLYCGFATARFGIYRILDFLMQYPEYRMSIQGAVEASVQKKLDGEYAVLLATGRVTINRKYLNSQELIDFASRFAIGFCCYDFSIPGMNTFNYQTAPSGKLFTYYAAGVPVIGSTIPGLASVRDFEAGVLISEFTPQAIRQAIETIMPERKRFSANGLRAAKHFDFKKTVAPFVDFLVERIS